MLERVDIEGHYCLTDLSVLMRPLTVLIGDNGTGKTDFLDAIRRMVGPGEATPEDASENYLRALDWLWLSRSTPTALRLLLLEDPENGVHPKRLPYMVKTLREIAQGRLRRPHGFQHAAQVVLTTYSPYLLDEIDLETDQVLVFRRMAIGLSTVDPVDAERMKNFLDEFKLGEVWFNEGEDGLVARPVDETAGAVDNTHP